MDGDSTDCPGTERKGATPPALAIDEGGPMYEVSIEPNAHPDKWEAIAQALTLRNEGFPANVWLDGKLVWGW